MKNALKQEKKNIWKTVYFYNYPLNVSDTTICKNATIHFVTIGF